MIRELLFSWEMWVIWYGTTAFVWTGIRLRKRKTEDRPNWEQISASPEEIQKIQDIPKISLNIDEDDVPTYRGQVINIRSGPDKPDWMKK